MPPWILWRMLDRKGWKVGMGYHRRPLAETGMYRMKTIFGVFHILRKKSWFGLALSQNSPKSPIDSKLVTGLGDQEGCRCCVGLTFATDDIESMVSEGVIISFTCNQVVYPIAGFFIFTNIWVPTLKTIFHEIRPQVSCRLQRSRFCCF